MVIRSFDTNNAINYAKKWALSRNKNYYNFDKLGGDCTNFVSQCIFAGCNQMNFSKTNGWYYNSISDRAPAWTGVNFLHNFLIANNSLGPFGSLISFGDASLGDVIQLGNETTFYHAMMITQITNNIIYTCSHTIDSLDRPLNSYTYKKIRVIKINGVRI